MQLDDFVRTTLVQIARGVHDAQQAVGELGGIVNPATLHASKESGAYFSTVNDMHHVFLVDFDVAVEVVESTGKSAEAGLSVATVVKLGAGGKAASSNSSSSLAVRMRACSSWLSSSCRPSRKRLTALTCCS